MRWLKEEEEADGVLGSRALTRKSNRRKEVEKEKQTRFYVKQIKILKRPVKVKEDNN